MSLMNDMQRKSDKSDKTASYRIKNAEIVEKSPFLLIKKSWYSLSERLYKPKAQGHKEHAGEEACEGVKQEHPEMAFAEQGIHFQAEGGKGSEPTAKANTEHQCRFIGKPGAFQGEPDDDAY